MEDVDTILSGGTVVTMNETFDVLVDGAVAVQGNAIVATGPSAEIAAHYRAAEVVDCAHRVVMPGLVNAHTHVPMTLLRGLADDLRLDVWLMGYMMPVEREFVHPDFCWLGTQLGCAEMIRSGTTCFADMYYYEEVVADATAQTGLRGICAQTVLRFPSPGAFSYDESLAYTRDFIRRWRGHELIVPAVGPHAAYTATPDLLQAAAALAMEFDVPLHIHVAETAQEAEDHRREFGMPVVPWLKKHDIFDAKTTAAHCVHLDRGEMLTLQHHNVGVAHNPTSNLKLASGIAPVQTMLELGLNVGIGTDGPASNNDLDMFEETRLAALLGKGATSDPTALPARRTLEMATIMGARALHVDRWTGSLEPGKRADLIVVDMRGVHNTPKFARDVNAVYSQLVYAIKSSDVESLMCNGRWLMRDRQLLTIDEALLQSEAAKLATRIDTFLMEREGSVLRKLVAIGGVEREKTFEVQVKVHLPDAQGVEQVLREHSELLSVRPTLRRQYDTYFIFHDKYGSRIRYREDEVVNDSGEVVDVVYRLTLTNETKDHEYGNSVVLSRSRFDAPADRSVRFYREYFQADQELEVHKTRRRYHVRFANTDFAVNIDSVSKPEMPGVFLEIKSRTWSAQDAERKALSIGDLLKLFGVKEQDLVKKEYLELALEATRAKGQEKDQG